MNNDLSDTVVILAPRENDSAIAAAVLREAGFKAEIADDLTALCNTLERSVGALVLAEEALVGENVVRLQGILSRQDSWSDLPIILMTTGAGSRACDLFSTSFSLLERPFSRTAMIRSVDVAMRARQRQYQVRDLLEEQIRANRARDEFFATLSHELRTPLSVILGWIEVMRSNRANQTLSDSALEILERNARMQKSLIDDLLDMSRIITEKMHFEFSNLVLGPLLKSIVAGFQPQAMTQNILLNVSLPDAPISIKGDAQRLTQAISNLISNAIKFSFENGTIQVKLAELKGQFQLTVEDNGKGIEPSFLTSIFDRLKQEDMSSTRVYGGLGLGLAIASHIIDAHHGTLVAHSEGRGTGTRMTMTLPKSHVVPLIRPTQESQPTVSSLRGIKILAVDDSPDILTLLEVLLGQAEAEVTCVESASKALEALEECVPDVILSDISMPNVDGYELIKTIRQRSVARGGRIPAVALTAYARDEERLRALKSGFQMHVSKPISNRELLSVITSLAR